MRQVLYKAALGLLPPRLRVLQGKGLTPGEEAQLISILRRHRCQAGSFRLFDKVNTRAGYTFGEAQPGHPVTPDTYFRVASISKMLTAACCLKMVEQGRLALDEDLNQVLPFNLQHPSYLHQPITLRMLMSHTSGLQDGKRYHAGLLSGAAVTDILAGDSYGDQPPGSAWRYSNLGAGLVACVMEAAEGRSFEAIMQAELFQPLGITASFYPQRITSLLADARRMLPPSRQPNFDARERQRRPLIKPDEPMPLYRYNLAQGNACLSGEGLQRCVQALMSPGYLSPDSLGLMRSPQASFGQRARNLRQGLGLFLLQDERLAPATLYGHQGNAYGAIHAAFFDPVRERGFLILTTSASEARADFLAELVEDLIAFVFGESHG